MKLGNVKKKERMKFRVQVRNEDTNESASFGIREAGNISSVKELIIIIKDYLEKI